MAALLSNSTPATRTLTPDEGRAFFDEQCRAYLGISGEELIRRWDAGKYEDIEDIRENWDILHVGLLPFGQQ